jgi:hypothetical protein
MADEGEDVSRADWSGDDGLTGRDRPRRSIKEKAEAAAEWPWTKISARASMVLVAPMLAVIAWFALDKLDGVERRMDDFAAAQEKQDTKLEQIGINQAEGKVERDGIKEDIRRIWDMVTGKKK